MAKFIDGARRFTGAMQAPAKRERRAFFEGLAIGQSPEALFITCADSRIDPCLITGTAPGDIFVYRNPGNFIPPIPDGSGKTHENPDPAAASIEYALKVLNVPHIVICGHTQCGALRAAMEGVDMAALPHVSHWLQYAPPSSGNIDTYTEENIRFQLRNIKTHEAVTDALARGAVTLHGWVYSIETCEIYELNQQSDTFQKIQAE